MGAIKEYYHDEIEKGMRRHPMLEFYINVLNVGKHVKLKTGFVRKIVLIIIMTNKVMRKTKIIEFIIFSIMLIVIYIMTFIISYREGQKDALNGKFKYELNMEDIDVKRIR